MNDKLEKFFNRLLPDISKKIIYQDKDRYILFDEYSIYSNNDYYTVDRYRDEKQFNFYKLNHATAWSVLDKYNKFYEAAKILELDLKLESIKVDKEIHKKFKKEKNSEKYMIFLSKFQQDLIKQRQFQREIDKYITVANICQRKGFENELKRTSRKKEQASD